MGSENNSLKKEWTWGYEKTEKTERIQSASIKNRYIEWCSDGYPGYANGYHSSQHIDDFLENGPSVSDVPVQIINEMTLVINQIKRKQIVKKIKISAMHLLYNSYHGLTLKEWSAALKKKYPGENVQTFHTILKGIIEKNPKIQYLNEAARGTVYTHIDLLL